MNFELFENYESAIRDYRGPQPDRTAYFLGEKERVDLDTHTHPDKIDAARDYLRSAVAALK